MRWSLLNIHPKAMSGLSLKLTEPLPACVTGPPGRRERQTALQARSLDIRTDIKGKLNHPVFRVKILKPKKRTDDKRSTDPMRSRCDVLENNSVLCLGSSVIWRCVGRANKTWGFGGLPFLWASHSFSLSIT